MLVKEARTIQNRFRNSANTKRTQDDSARSFKKLMWQGKTEAALKMLSKDYKNGVLKIDDDIFTELKSEHPTAAEVKQESLLFRPINELSHCYFDEIDEIMIAKAVSLEQKLQFIQCDSFSKILQLKQ